MCGWDSILHIQTNDAPQTALQHRSANVGMPPLRIRASPADLLRLNSYDMQCRQCGKAFPAVTDPPVMMLIV